MANLSLLPLLLLAAAVLISPPHAAGATLRLDFHHRFSDHVRRWVESRGGGAAAEVARWWPKRGTVEYYAALARHDRALRGRALSGATSSSSPLTFSNGNQTLLVSPLGFLHYAMVSIGTPSVSFLVALDTGSDLFWLPCDCQSCAPTTSTADGFAFEFNIYSPNMSLTSQTVPCNSNLCELQNKCSGANGNCPYKVAYVSADTSSSGILVEDVLYLTTEDASPQVVNAQIMFGCGQVQTGSFLDVAAPNGLLGLGMEKISVPSILSSTGLTADSFSMCFGHDGIGRINFGDQGSSDQEETPFSANLLHPTYGINITGVSVGNSSIDGGFNALVDSGTSFTYLADPAYTQLSESFDAQVKDSKSSPDPKIPFEYCYYMSANNATKSPLINLTTKGGSQFPVTDPIIIISIPQHKLVYCLAVIKSSKLNIIGQNFMTGLRVVFDRERMILGWKQFNCYDVEDSNPFPVKPKNSSSPAPSTTVEPNMYSPEATKENGNNSQVTVLTPPLSHSPCLKSFTSKILLLLLPLVFL